MRQTVYKDKSETFSLEEVDPSLPSRFQHQADLYPSRLAVKSGNQTFSYSDLARFSNNLAGQLLEIDLEKNKPVVVYLPHEAALIAAVMGILYAGKCYLPIDPAYPADWTNSILSQIDSCILITDTARLESNFINGGSKCRIINLDLVKNASSIRRPVPVYPGDNAYIIFTSGTAGYPKGVVHSHRNVMRMVKDYTNAVQIKPEDRVSMVSSCSFSMSVIDIFSSLMNGAGKSPSS